MSWWGEENVAHYEAAAAATQARQEKADHDHEQMLAVSNRLAKGYREFNEADAHTDPLNVEMAKVLYEMNSGQEFAGTDEEAARYGIEEMGRYKYAMFQAELGEVEEMGTVGYAAKMLSDDTTDLQRLAFLHWVNADEAMDAKNTSELGRAATAMLKDPTSYAGAGLLMNAGYKLIGRKGAGKILQNQIANRLKLTALGIAEGYAFGHAGSAAEQQAIIGASDNPYFQQQVDHDVMRDIQMGGIGSLMGGVLSNADVIGKKMLGIVDDAVDATTQHGTLGMGVGPIDKTPVDEPDLMFLHNTREKTLEKYYETGGLPMPSLAITKKDIPFEGFGEITLVGKPAQFDPAASSLNDAWSADAFTTRAPEELKIAEKGAWKKFDDAFDGYGEYIGDIVYKLENGTTKKSGGAGSFDMVRNFFDSARGARVFAKQAGIEGDLKYDQISEIKESPEYTEWVNGWMADLFSAESYYNDNGKIKVWDADAVTKTMKKERGAGKENVQSAGRLRAMATPKFKSLKDIKSKSGRLMTRDQMEAAKKELDEGSRWYGSVLNEYHPDANAVDIGDTARSLISMKGDITQEVLSGYGFNEIPQPYVDAMNEFKRQLIDAPTEYFESKPARTVSLDNNSFAGAIVPDNADPRVFDMLKRRGIEAHVYSTDAERVALRDKFKGHMFVRPETAVGTGAIGLTMLNDDEDI